LARGSCLGCVFAPLRLCVETLSRPLARTRQMFFHKIFFQSFPMKVPCFQCFLAWLCAGPLVENRVLRLPRRMNAISKVVHNDLSADWAVGVSWRVSNRYPLSGGVNPRDGAKKSHAKSARVRTHSEPKVALSKPHRRSGVSAERRILGPGNASKISSDD